MLNDLNRSVISLRELIRLSCGTGLTFWACSLGGPQGLHWVDGDVCLVGRAGKFSLLTVGSVGVGLEAVGLGALGEGLALAVLSASSLVLYKGQPL